MGAGLASGGDQFGLRLVHAGDQAVNEWVGRWAAAGLLLGALFASGCAVPEPREVSAGHVDTGRPPPPADIPEPVRQTPFLPKPAPAPAEETYTVVVDGVPVKELLFALARDANRNVDIHPDVSGTVTLNAVDQSLFQILDRIARQVDLRYRVEEGTIVISQDTPFFRTYEVDYVNMSRDTTQSVKVSTQITSIAADSEDGGGGGDNNSTSTVTSTSNNRFWETLVSSIEEIIAPSDTAEERENVIANPEGGILLVRATARQHEEVQRYLDQVLSSARRQVLIEATVVEVDLNDRYQAGVDFTALFGDAGVVQQSLIGGNLATPPFFLFEIADEDENPDITSTVRLLKEFGDTKVLSSPKIMVLNNQAATLRVVDNVVFFQIDVTVIPATNISPAQEARESKPRTVPVGLIMTVIPQVNDSDTITLNIRPTISRISRFVEDPENPGNQVPEIRVREMESMLKLESGQIAVLGGLMQDEVRKDSRGLPLLSDLPRIGEAFKFRDNDFTKTELVIFLRPIVVRRPSIEADLRDFEQFLPKNLPDAQPVSTLDQRRPP